MTRTQKVTVRLDESEAATLLRLCDLYGVSQTAMIQALVGVTGELLKTYDWKPPRDWTADAERKRWGARLGEVAVSIDVARRSRRAVNR